MDLGVALNSINWNKNNEITNSNNPELAEKLYPPFPVARSLSYSADCVLLVNELNTRGLVDFGITNKMHYEFLLNVVSKKKRFNKWVKPAKDEIVGYVMEMENLSYAKALDVVYFMTEEQKQELCDMYDAGGIIRETKPKTKGKT